jgi:hypothetical protein
MRTSRVVGLMFILSMLFMAENHALASAEDFNVAFWNGTGEIAVRMYVEIIRTDGAKEMQESSEAICSGRGLSLLFRSCSTVKHWRFVAEYMASDAPGDLSRSTMDTGFRPALKCSYEIEGHLASPVRGETGASRHAID